MTAIKRYLKSPRFPSFFSTLLLITIILFLISIWLWFGAPYIYYKNEVTYHHMPPDASYINNVPDYRQLPLDIKQDIKPIAAPILTELSEDKLNERSSRLRNAINNSFAQYVKGIPSKDDKWCERMTLGKLDVDEHKKLEEWEFNFNSENILKNNEKKETISQKCNKIKQMFPFINEPLSEEEKQYPLAYGMLVYKSIFQVYMMMSSIYQPQNVYCIIIDEKATKEFKTSLLLFSDCFSNIFVMESVGSIGWCEYGTTRAVFSCLRYLTELKHEWKYFQYLSGFDLPLKTNLEMVRIFKQLYGSINMEVSLYQNGRLSALVENVKPPLTLWKSSMSSLVPREAANEMMKSDKVLQLMQFLQHTLCSDETIWATIAGNPKELQIPGGFDAASFFNQRKECLKFKKEKQVSDYINEELKLLAEKYPNEQFYPDNYYISRYQVWGDSLLHKCYGKWVSSSCVFGINDIPILLKRPGLSQHKMYLSYQPSAYFCLWKTIHNRALDWKNQKEFKATAYSELPTVKHVREGNKSNATFYDEKCYLSLW